MKKEKLIELYNQMKKWEFIPEGKIEGVKYLTDEEIDIIVNSKYSRQVFNYLVIPGKEKEIRKNIANIISNASDIDSALNLSNIASNSCLYYSLSNEQYLKIFNMLSDSPTYINYEIANLVNNKKVLASGEIFKLIQIICNAKTKYQANYISNLVSNKYILNSQYLIPIVLAANNVKEQEKVDISEEIYEEISKGDDKAKKELRDLFDILVSTNFWTIFKRDYNLAMYILAKENIDNNEEIDKFTKVKIKIK